MMRMHRGRPFLYGIEKDQRSIAKLKNTLKAA
jgi:hypothetical protein